MTTSVVEITSLDETHRANQDDEDSEDEITSPRSSLAGKSSGRTVFEALSSPDRTQARGTKFAFGSPHSGAKQSHGALPF